MTAAAITFFTAAPGEVVKVLDPPEVPADAEIEHWSIEAKVGDTVRELRSSKDRLGWAIVSGSSPEACQTATRTLQSTPLVITA